MPEGARRALPFRYQKGKTKKMKGRETYVSPRIEVRQVFLEGAAAVSHCPVIESGEVKYTPYEVEGVQYEDVVLL